MNNSINKEDLEKQIFLLKEKIKNKELILNNLLNELSDDDEEE